MNHLAHSIRLDFVFKPRAYKLLCYYHLNELFTNVGNQNTRYSITHLAFNMPDINDRLEIWCLGKCELI